MRQEVAKAAEELRNKNLELEKSIRPRDLPQVAFSEKMRLFAGTHAAVETIPDFEARRTADLIANSLRLAGWEVGPVVVNSDASDATMQRFFRSGITVMQGGPNWDFLRSMPTLEARRVYTPMRKRFEAAVASLMKELNGYGVKTSGFAAEESIPSDTVRILVSVKPIPGEMDAERGNKIFIAPGVVVPPNFIKIEPGTAPPTKKEE